MARKVRIQYPGAIYHVVSRKGAIAWVILGIDRCLSIVLYVGMPRKLRIEYPGAMYHVMSRAGQREDH